MAHYAFIDENNIVVEVITGRNEDEVVDGITDWEQWYGNYRGLTCKQTSYNTFRGQHKNGGTPFRGNFAGIGYTYDAQLNAFIPPKKYPSWILNTNTFDWVAPVSKPNDDAVYVWSELQTNWIVLPEKPDASTAWMWDESTDQWIEFS